MPTSRKRKSPSSRTFQRVSTYHELGRFADGFIKGHLPLVILVGGPGLGKSEMFRRALKGKKSCWMEGNATPFGMYERLYKHRNKPVVIDDVDALCFDRASVSLLKSLCQTVPEKTVSWHSNERFLEARGIPSEFKTTSKIVIITNNWRTLNRNVSALEDRGFGILFEPAADEVHRAASAWFKDEEIYGWFGENLHRVGAPTFRNYIRAAQLKACGMDWTRVLGDIPGIKRAALARELLENGSFSGNEERAREFSKRGGGTRGTFFNYKRRIEAEA